MCTIYTRKTQIFIIPPTGTDLVRGDGVVVLGAGGLGGHATTTSAGRAAWQLDLVGGQRQSDQLSWPGTRVLACVLTRMRLQTSKMATMEAFGAPYQQKQLDPDHLATQPATPSAQNATSTWAFSPARP